LAVVAQGADLHLVSGDKDYRSPLSDGDFNNFLQVEWGDKKKSQLYYYSKISDFFKDCFPTIKIASEVESDSAIGSLSKSGSFATTHICIAELAKFDGFSVEQVERLVKIPSQNNQVSMIVADPDVHAFYSKLQDKYAKALKKEDADTLAEIVSEGEPDPNDVLGF
jgi:hypothetical protein